MLREGISSILKYDELWVDINMNVLVLLDDKEFIGFND